ncbi:hypothetical protein HPB51_011139 [Rhipicephalus microplus]|uniref:Uncharacterized protein n=1 Tax=Rhipicephalus microplus TaxID=6941 RepID=A0A9J6E168_RHIMP|nr:hypothetical protein HPB51_011139 [Rhipicephalus microplus]
MNGHTLDVHQGTADGGLFSKGSGPSYRITESYKFRKEMLTYVQAPSAASPTIQLSSELMVALEPDSLRRATICEREMRKLGIHYTVHDHGVSFKRLPVCLLEKDERATQGSYGNTVGHKAQCYNLAEISDGCSQLPGLPWY